MRRVGPIAVITALLTGTVVAQNPGGALEIGTTAFESYVESLRLQAGIPAISGALVRNGDIVWERGLGFANLENSVRATPDTTYPIADLSQTFAAVLILRCVERGQLDLDEPLRRYGVAGAAANATLRQALSHTSGGSFRYEPERFAPLTAAVEYCADQPYRMSAAELLDRVVMVDSVPGLDIEDLSPSDQALFERGAMERYRRSLERLAVPYRVDRRGRATRNEIPADGINAATGIVSTVRDLARLDAAIDDGLLVTAETRAGAWSQRAAAPTGTGWFVQNYRGTTVVWHFGTIPNAYSALMVKVPSRRATMILLANGDGLTAPFQLEAGDVTRSVFASVFLRMLI